MILLSDHAIRQSEGKAKQSGPLSYQHTKNIIYSSGGQALIGGLDAKVCRNFFGSQIQSASYEITGDFRDSKENFGGDTAAFHAVFIRAPAIIKVGPAVKVLATIRATPHSSVLDELNMALSSEGGRVVAKKRKVGNLEAERTVIGEDGKLQVIVAVRQGKNRRVSVVIRINYFMYLVPGNILATAFHPELTTDLRWHAYFCQIVASFKESEPSATLGAFSL